MLAISLITLGDPLKVTGGYLYHRRLADAAPAHGARMAFASFPEAPFPLPMLAGGAVLRKARAARPDVLVVDSIAAAFLAPWAAGGSVRVPLVASLHQPPGGIDHGAVRSALQGRLDRIVYRRARILVAASRSLADDLAARGFADESIRVVAPGRDVATAASGEPSDMRLGRAAAFLSVGNWVERKGTLDLLEAFARLPGDLATLHLVGSDRADPAYATRVRARLARPDVAARAIVHGEVPRERVAAFYRDSDAFVLASTREPYGTVYGEAMAYGLPVVGWRAGNLPYLAEHDREGLLVPPGDVEGLARALAALATDGSLRARLGAAALRRAQSFPTWHDTAASFFDALRAALAV